MHDFKKNNPKNKSFKSALFPGGLQGLMIFLKTHIRYLEVASKTLHHSGTVIIRFWVEKDGTAVPYSIVKGVGPFYDIEAWQAIKEMPKWIPARMNGKPVKEMFHLPIKFTL